MLIFFLHTKFYKLSSNYNEAIYLMKIEVKVSRPKVAQATGSLYHTHTNPLAGNMTSLRDSKMNIFQAISGIYKQSKENT